MHRRAATLHPRPPHRATPGSRGSSTPLRRLIADIDQIVHETPQDLHPAAVATALEEVVLEPDLLPAAAKRSSLCRYRTHIVHVAADGSFSVVALVWLPGQATPIHSHRAWCVVGVHAGQEREISYRLDPTDPHDPLTFEATRCYRAGQVTWLDAERSVHLVENAGREMAVSVHVYGTDYQQFGSSILEVFRPPLRKTAQAPETAVNDCVQMGPPR